MAVRDLGYPSTVVRAEGPLRPETRIRERTASAAVRVACGSSSVRVRWGPSLVVAVVTYFVTWSLGASSERLLPQRLFRSARLGFGEGPSMP